MTIELLLAVLAAAVVCAYIPWGERALRNSSLGLAVLASAALGYLAYSAVTDPEITGYAHMWNVDEAVALTFGILAVAYVAAAVVGYVQFGREHIHGSMSLVRLRHHAAALPVVVASIVAVAAGNNVWFLPLAVVLMGALWYSVEKSKSIGFSGAVAALLALVGVILVVQSGPAWNVSLWAGQSLTGFASVTDINAKMLTAGAVLVLASIASVIGAFPFALGAIGDRRKLVAPFAILLNTAVVSAFVVAGLRYQGLVSAVSGVESWIDNLLVVGGLLTLAYAVGVAWKTKDAADITEGIRAWVIASILFVLAVGAAGVIAAALFLVALVPTMIALATVRTVRAERVAWYLSLALPASSLFIPFVILIGYGMQLRVWLTPIFAALYVVLALLIARFAGRQESKEETPQRDTVAVVAFAAIALNVALGIFFTTPNAIIFAIRVIQTVAAPSF